MALSDLEVYGFSGKMGAGKDYLAAAFALMLPPRPTVTLALADELKLQAIVFDDADRAKVFGIKDEETRRALQLRGTEHGRNVYGPDVWVRFLHEQIMLHHSRGIRRVFVPDVRFPNEVEIIHRLGGKVFRVVARQRTAARMTQEHLSDEAASHSSETALDHWTNFDYVLYNDPGEKALDMLRDLATRDGYLPPVIFCDLDGTICRYNEIYVEAFEAAVAATAQFTKRVGDGGSDFASYASTHFWELTALAESKPFTREAFVQTLYGAVMLALHDSHFVGKPAEESDDLLTRALNEVGQKRIYPLLWKIGMGVHDADFAELPGAVAAVRALQVIGRVVIVTKGHRADQARKLARLGLLDVEVAAVSIKTEDTYRILLDLYPGRGHVMIGDSKTEDIDAAAAAGIATVVHITPDAHLATQAAEIVRQVEGGLLW